MPPVNDESQFLPATAYAVLGLLSFDQELSGYDLRQWALRSLRHFYWSPAQSQIYRELRRLEQLDYVASRLVPQRGRPDKTLYRITDAGIGELRRWIDESPVGEPVIKHPTALRLFFGHMTSTERITEILRGHLVTLEAILDDLEELQAGLEDDGAGPARVALAHAAAICEADWRHTSSLVN